MSTRVYLLGAGFSRAINDRMPTLAELSSIVESAIAAHGKPPIPGQGTPLARDFERWLTYLADSAPWLDDGDALRNRAAFADVSAAVHAALSALQYIVVAEPQPDWLDPLVRYWQDTSATVITFNYDVLVEVAWIQIYGDVWWYLYSVPTTPAASRAGTVWGGDLPETGLKLLKLHGSLNWYYSGITSPPGDVLYDLGVGGGWQVGGADARYDSSLVADREPCIVPPAATKSPYYGNRTLHALWQQAAQALRDADEVVVMGFSLPPSDQLVSAMLASELRDDCIVTPIDRSSEVVERFRALLDLPGPTSRVRGEFVGRPDVIREWVKNLPPSAG